MTEVKTPEVGEWYRDSLYDRCRIESVTERDICLRHRRAVNVNEHEDHLVVIYTSAFMRGAEFLPWCTSFDDVEPKPPQEYFDLTSMDDHVLRRDLDFASVVKDEGYSVNHGKFIDGIQWPDFTMVAEAKTWGWRQFRCRIEDAPKASTTPAESPDDWVPQDRVPLRSCDQWRFTHWTPDVWSNGGNDKPLSVSVAIHGAKLPGHGNSTLELRCRRKDLPPVEQKPATQTIIFHEVMRNNRNGGLAISWTSTPLDDDIPTGRTETREVPR